MRLEASFSKLGEVLDKSAMLFRSSAYKKRWPEVANVTPVNDLGMIEKLDACLDSEFESGEAQKKLVLFTPAHRHNEELPLAHSYVFGRMSKKPTTSPYMLVGSWISFLEGKGRSPSTSEAKENRIHLLDEGVHTAANSRDSVLGRIRLHRCWPLHF
jgi:uncharacterized protein (TIGR04141 family)